MPIEPRTLTDRREIRALLSQDAIATAYQLGDLDEPYFGLSHWYAAGADDHLDAVALLYTGLSMPVLLTYGDPTSMASILDRYQHDLPGRMIAHMPPDHLSALVRYYRTSGAGKLATMRPMLRMGLRSTEFVDEPDARASANPSFEVVPLAMRDTGEIMELYQFYPDNFFEPAQLASDHYYGVRLDGRLASVAGVHVFAPDSRVACLGNIVTHPDSRGRGLSTACTRHLCRRLISAGVDVLALNVDRDNVAAVRVYEKLGFREHNTYLEGMLHSLSGALDDSRPNR